MVVACYADNTVGCDRARCGLLCEPLIIEYSNSIEIHLSHVTEALSHEPLITAYARDGVEIKLVPHFIYVPFMP